MTQLAAPVAPMALIIIDMQKGMQRMPAHTRTQSRFEAVIAGLQISVENTQASHSRIVDADYAAETANLTRAQILQQAGTAMVSQANSAPQSVLSLLQN